MGTLCTRATTKSWAQRCTVDTILCSGCILCDASIQGITFLVALLYQLAINEYMEASKYIASVDQRDEPWKEISRANCFYNIGFCLYKLGDYDAAINEAEKSLYHYEQHHGSVNNKCICYTFLGWCHLKRNEYDKALTYFQTELDLRLQFVPTEKQDSDEDIKFARSNIQICQNSLTPWYAKIICCCRKKYRHVYITT
ncbi:unnamed protein product [Clavelina lepadiformis]|uniref:Uncharacterized protein n=1 Tax=Clavelina lepadiformis TaxID=159417 RepID=A0ABP0F3Y0_CLALP